MENMIFNFKNVLSNYLENFMDFDDVKYFSIPKPYDFKSIAMNLSIFKKNNINVVAAIQTHSNIPLVIDNLNYEIPLYGDALITNIKNLIIGVTTADCIPLLFYEPEIKVIASVHAGWRGLYSGIIKNTIHHMIEFYGCNPNSVFCYIGPSICFDHYEIKDDLVNLIKEKFYFYNKIIKFKESKFYMDLKQFAIIQLNECGVPEKNIKKINICTYECQSYYSARRDGNQTGRFFTGIIMV